jgi:predicted metalloprotease with PDZ domain
LTVLADEAGQLDATPAQIEAHRRLVEQADRLFGTRPWRHYDVMLALSSEFGQWGLEHQESSENGARPNYFRDWDKGIRSRWLIPHEFAHAWNGKLRRPADLLTPNFNVPMRNSLLWVYEGLANYLEWVLTARSGLATPEQTLDKLADVAASMNQRPGREWRNLQDTTNDSAILSRRAAVWPDWQRGQD